MFIRNQRGMVLYNTDNLISISVEEYSFIVMIIAKPVNEDTIILGTYEGRKRADSILDDKNLVQTSTRRSSCGVNTTIGD